jgi:thymidylate synthase (FAD)
MHYIDLRSSNGTQEEHRRIAVECGEIFQEVFPDIAEAMRGS